MLKVLGLTAILALVSVLAWWTRASVSPGLHQETGATAAASGSEAGARNSSREDTTALPSGKPSTELDAKSLRQPHATAVQDARAVLDRKSTRLNSSHESTSRMPSSIS